MTPRCTKCPLYTTCKSIKVEGRGSKNPKYLFVGIAPGAEEDAQNKCWVGPCGQLLTDMIKEYQLLPARVTNAVRCFPPSDRKPKRTEILACQDYLFQEIKEFKPKIIVAVGNIPLQILTGKEGITQYSGRFVGEQFGAKIYALVHPSYVLRSPRNATTFENHIRSIKNSTSGGIETSAVPRPKVVLQPLSWVMAKMAEAKPDLVTFDFETTGKYKQFGGEIRLCGFYFNKTAYVCELANPKDFKKFLVSPYPKCAHNSVFEMRWCLDEFGVIPKNLHYDPMLMHYLLDENTPHDLETLAGKYLGANPWGIEGLMQEQGKTWADVPLNILVPYNALDVAYTDKLARKLCREFYNQPEFLKYYKTVLLPMAKLCAIMEHRGMKIDKEWAQAIDEEYRTRCDQLQQEIFKLPPVTDYYQRCMLSKKNWGLNLGSPAQIADIAFNVLKLHSSLKTNGGKPSARYEALKLLEGKHKFIDLYLKWKELSVLRNNYLQKFPQMADHEDLIHPNFNPAFQVTARVSVSNPPAANIPQDPKVRGMIISRFPGGQILSRDYSQLELRLIASESNEPKMLEIFRQDGDIHSLTAEIIFGKNFTKEERMIGKKINFTIFYGAGEYRVAQELNVNRSKAAELIARVREGYRYAFHWMDKQYRFIREHEYIVSKFGNRRRFPGARIADDYTFAGMCRQAGNFPIQSQGAVINNLAGILINKLITLRKLRSLYIHQVHDSVLVDVAPGEEEELSLLTKEVMENTVPKTYCPWLLVPLKTEFELAKRWGGAEEKIEVPF